jgi:hypothetical protein
MMKVARKPLALFILEMLDRAGDRDPQHSR